MHRIDEDGYVLVGGERRFIDRSLPTYEGTIDGAHWNNAIQEEICTVIENAGLTLRSSGASDESAGWDQLWTAIFDSQAIDDNALATNLSLIHFGQGYLSFGEFYLDDEQLLFGVDGVVSVDRQKKGTKWYGSGAPGTVFPYRRHATYNITTYVSTASVDPAISETADGHYHTIGYEYDNIFNTNINISARIYDAKIVIEKGAGNIIAIAAEVEFSGSTTWELVRIIQFTATSSDDLSSATAVYLDICYDGTYLDP